MKNILFWNTLDVRKNQDLSRGLDENKYDFVDGRFITDIENFIENSKGNSVMVVEPRLTFPDYYIKKTINGILESAYKKMPVIIYASSSLEDINFNGSLYEGTHYKDYVPRFGNNSIKKLEKSIDSCFDK